MEMVKFWPLIESKLLNRLRWNFAQLITSTRRLAKYVKYKASLFYFYFFSRTRLLNQPVHGISRKDVSKHALWRKEVPFFGPHDGRRHFGVQIPPKPSKIAFYKHVRASANGLKTNDVIEDWRHWLPVARSRPNGVGPILFIASGKILQQCILQYLQRNDSVSWCTIFGTEIQFLQNLHRICRQSVLQVGAKKDPICCLLESFKNFLKFDKQAADIRRYSN